MPIDFEFYSDTGLVHSLATVDFRQLDVHIFADFEFQKIFAKLGVLKVYKLWPYCSWISATDVTTIFRWWRRLITTIFRFCRLKLGRYIRRIALRVRY